MQVADVSIMTTDVALLEGCADPFGPKVLRSSAGTSFQIEMAPKPTGQRAAKPARPPLTKDGLPQSEGLPGKIIRDPERLTPGFFQDEILPLDWLEGINKWMIVGNHLYQQPAVA